MFVLHVMSTWMFVFVYLIQHAFLYLYIMSACVLVFAYHIYMCASLCILCQCVLVFAYHMFTWMSTGVCNRMYTSMLVFARHICTCMLVFAYHVSTCMLMPLYHMSTCMLVKESYVWAAYFIFVWPLCLHIISLEGNWGAGVGDLCLTLYPLYT